MGNVISIHAEIFTKRNEAGESLNPANILSKLTALMGGRSYNGYPIIIKEVGGIGGIGSSIRISYGEKGEPSNLFRFFEENKNGIDRLFARTQYEGGDWDLIFSLPSENPIFDEIARKCRYGFDEILFKPKESNQFIGEVYETFGDYKSIKLYGEMNSVSCLTHIDLTDWISFPIEHEVSLISYAPNHFSCENENLLNKIIDQSADIIFKFNHKTVHRKIDTAERVAKGYPASFVKDFSAIQFNGGKLEIHSSGWQNCVDTAYLDYIKMIGRELHQ